jgi:hypothetical protein
MFRTIIGTADAEEDKIFGGIDCGAAGAAALAVMVLVQTNARDAPVTQRTLRMREKMGDMTQSPWGHSKLT